jgi:hypothetical protein
MALAGAGAAWVIQNLSCGYYLFFFSPIVVAYIVWELAVRRLWTDVRTLGQLAAVAAAVAVCTAPFLIPYLQLRQLGASPRSLAETIRFSADTHAYFTAPPELWIAGRLMQAWPQPEGLLFPGFTITALATAALIASAGSRDGVGGPDPAGDDGSDAGALRFVERIAVWALVAGCVAVAALAAGWTVRFGGIKVTSLTRVGSITVGLASVLLVLSRQWRRRAREWLATPVGFFAAATLFAIVMSLGPRIQARGRNVANANLYTLFYDYLPGFDALRVPARFGMVVAFGLAVLAGCAAAKWSSMRSRPIVWIAGLLIALEACSMPLTINYNSSQYQQEGLAPLPASLDTEASRRLYRAIAQLPAQAAIVELPLGEPAFDIRYMFHSTRHWRRLVNGYSGGHPAAYEVLDQSLRDADTRPEYAWQVLRQSGATHAIVHEAFFAGNRGGQITEWLRAHGAREIESIGNDRIFELLPR